MHAAAMVAVALVLAGAGPGRAADDPPPFVEYAHDALTVRVTRMPLQQLIDEIGRQAGAEIQGGIRTQHDVTAEFEHVPLPEALHRVLGDQNFTLKYGEGGKLRAVKLLGGPQAPEVAKAAPAPAPAPATPPADPAGNLMRLVAAHPPVRITGHLSQVLATDHTSVQQLIETSVHHGDATVRGEAARRTMALLEAEPDLRTAVMGTLNTMPDADIANLLNAVAGDHAQELATTVTSMTHSTELRVKASSVLQALKAQSPGGG